MTHRPRLLLTMGDVAGVGPEIIAGAWPRLVESAQPIVVGCPHWLRRALQVMKIEADVQVIAKCQEAQPTLQQVPCLPGTSVDLKNVATGTVSAAAGRAAFDFLCTAIDRVQAGEADGIVTAPLHKEGLHAAGINVPGHTEILAERTGAARHGMMLWSRGPDLPAGLGVVHVTLHIALRDVFGLLSTAAVLEKIELLDAMLQRLLDHPPRIAVAALNPHASDGGLFGDEEERLIAPAVREAQGKGLQVIGPLPSDTLFVRGRRGEFDGVVAMYHDQGHIALKLLGGLHAVNITVGLPLVRTSVAHGTAYDIAWKGQADPTSMVEAARVAGRLVERK